ncbi:MAG: GntR family transcriptional regulator [Chitinivibrionales bacterium]|nr:GntR family transcriptional regulator [Chitinivibrionales bacterium]
MRFVTAMARRARNAKRSRLPTVAQMATQAGVSTATMWKAVRTLVDRGVLQARPRAGIHVTDIDPSSAAQSDSLAPPPQGQRWEKVAAKIASDITHGVHAAGEDLPSMKVLAQQHGVCRATLRKALARLETERLIVPHNRRYRVAFAHGRSARSTLLLIHWVPEHELASAIDAECARVGLHLRSEPLIPTDRLLRTIASLRTRRGNEAVVGHLIATTGANLSQYTQLIRALAPSGLPTAIVDETGSGDIAALRGGRLVRAFSLQAHRLPGVLMGRHLLELGHRRVAYLSPVHDSVWSVARLDGLRAAFAQAGVPQGVLTFTSVGTADESRGRARAEADLAWLREKLSHGGPRQRRLALAVDMRARELSWMLQLSHIAQRHEQLMRDAIGSRGITAWVIANDLFAIYALRFLEQQGIEVPRELSVAGFDDTMQAFTSGLTSYNPDRRAGVQAALSFVLGSQQIGSAGGQGRVVQILGYVTPRRSTARRG